MSLRKDKDYLFNDIILSTKIKSKKKIENNSSIVEFKCCICFKSSTNLKFINCIKGCIQDNLPPKGKTYNCCQDKAICQDCIVKCNFNCPFCKAHTLYHKLNFPKKKRPFAIRRQIKLKKLNEKNKKLKKKLDYQAPNIAFWYLLQSSLSHISSLENEFNLSLNEELSDWGSEIETIDEYDDFE